VLGSLVGYGGGEKSEWGGTRFLMLVSAGWSMEAGVRACEVDRKGVNWSP